MAKKRPFSIIISRITVWRPGRIQLIGIFFYRNGEIVVASCGPSGYDITGRETGWRAGSVLNPSSLLFVVYNKWKGGGMRRYHSEAREVHQC